MILIDAGNTRAKLALGGDAAPESTEAFAYDDAFERDVAAWLSAHRGDAALLACVAGDDTRARIERVLAAAGVPVEQVTTPRECLGLVCGYDDHARWGVDRFLSSLGLWRDGLAPFVVASAGTAIAIDVVDAEGLHRGGLIAPSPHAMRRAVLGATANVRVLREGTVRGLGRNTEDGLESGTWLAAAALIDRAFADADPASTLCLTGGDALALSPLLRSTHEIVPDAALRGLCHYAGTRRGPLG